MKLRDILRTKGATVVTVSEVASVGDAVQAMVKARVGSALVLAADGRIAGIVTERDVLKATAQHGGGTCGLLVADLMTRDVLVAEPNDTVDYVLSLMSERRMRHVPVIDGGGKLAGIVSIGDAVRAKSHLAEVEVRHLNDYISGKYPG